MQRELLKVQDIIRRAKEHHQKRDESNAALHAATTVRYSVLTSQLVHADEALEQILAG